MNALLVDDDYFVVAALEKKIDWSALAFEQVFTAYSIAQARDILRRHPVHIMICDIEMPQGSGLELLAWIREERYGVQAIFLTNYADFNYAQKAIELQSFDYFLKPIAFDKLTLIIRKAAAKAEEQAQIEKAVREGNFWMQNRNKRVEHFWSGLLTGKHVPSRQSDIARAMAERNLSYGMTDIFQPVYVTLFPHDASLGREDKPLFDYALANVLRELLQEPDFSVEALFETKAFDWTVMLKWNRTPDTRLIEGICGDFIRQANRFLKCDAFCSIADSRSLADIHLAISDWAGMNADIVKRRNRIMLLEQYREREAAYTPPDLALLEELLGRDDPAAFLAETTRYLQSLADGKALNASVLSQFRLDLIQLVYAWLKSREIQAHKLYTGKTNDQLFMQSLSSIEDMKSYLGYLVGTAAQYRDFTAEPKSVVEEIKQHVRSRLGEPLTRTGLAEIVYLNPDYLARLFKKEAGVSLGTYIIRTRINAAKQLLATTQQSVNAIAAKVGYANFSHFSKLFKQETGCTPNEYRRRREEGSG